MAGPQLKLTGKAAVEAAAKILPTAHSIVVSSSMGNVELKPGAIWSGNKMLVECATMYVRYMIDDRLYEWDTGAFVLDEWLSAVSKGAAHAKGMVILAKAEYALLSGIFVPWYLMLGVGCAKVGLFYHNNSAPVDKAMKLAPKVIQLLQDLKRRSPALFNKLVVTAARDLLINLPKGITAEDIAFFIGRVIRETNKTAGVISLRIIMKIMAKVGAIVSAIHLPAIAGRAASGAAAKMVTELQHQLAAAGFTITEAEARTILNEIRSSRDIVAKLQQFEAACKELIPTLEVLQTLYSRME